MRLLSALTGAVSSLPGGAQLAVSRFLPHGICIAAAVRRVLNR